MEEVGTTFLELISDLLLYFGCCHASLLVVNYTIPVFPQVPSDVPQLFNDSGQPSASIFVTSPGVVVPVHELGPSHSWGPFKEGLWFPMELCILGIPSWAIPSS